MTGFITSVQRMSIHDGPGIRSTVFLKGCNFRCRWCHNPETWSSDIQLQWIQEKCIGCGVCVEDCGDLALRLNPDGVALDRSKCSLCGKCTDSCVSGALSIVGRRVEARELADELIADKCFYDESGGGVTLSGGEPLLQPAFVGEVARICEQQGIHVVIESNLSASRKQIKEIMPFVDLWLVDLKFADDERHKEWTGASNRQTLDNLRFLSEMEADVIVRTPVIPGANDTPEEITNICGILQELNIKQYELTPFHSLGFDKFRRLGMENPLENLPVGEPVSLRALNTIIHNYQLNTI